MNKEIPKSIFNIFLILAVFLSGGIIAENNMQPYKFLREGYNATRILLYEIFQEQNALLGKSIYDGTGIVFNNKDKANNGLTIIQGIFSDGPSIKLIDPQGKNLHTWPVNFFEIWPKPSHLDKKYWPQTINNFDIQGMSILKNGSIILNISEKGTVKLNHCGEVVWTIDYPTHHSITPVKEGFWIPTLRDIDKIPQELLFNKISLNYWEEHNIKDNRYDNLVTLFNHEQKVLREFSILDSLIKGGFERNIYDSFNTKFLDLTHINDIEIVTQALSKKIPNIKVGDLLISIRQMHMLIIMDQFTGEIKWSHQGQWIRQHDPDITPEGNIRLFNNSRKNFSFNRPSGSNLIELDPETEESWIVYPKVGQPSFYTDIMGTHQQLENGNILITESRAGRVFEITADGEIVWDFVLPYDEEYASLIESSERISNDFFTVQDWNCPRK